MPLITDKPCLAAHCLINGGIIAYPTEAVYGIGCLPENEISVARLRQIKQRPHNQGVILISDRLKRLEPYLQALSPRQRSLLQTRRLRPVTWLVPAADHCPASLRGMHSRLAIRLTTHPLVTELCRLTGSALISTSANRRGQPPAKTAHQVTAALGQDIDCILTGLTGTARTVSEIRDIDTGTIYR
jgi:L-threonylcarbamoyladenylate synthase